MKKSTSSLAAVVVASLLAAGATTVSMAGESAGHRIASGHASGHRADHDLLCYDSSDDGGFGGFSGAPGHPFTGVDNCGTDWVGDNGPNPFWSPEALESWIWREGR